MYDPAKKGKEIKSTFYGDKGKKIRDLILNPVTDELLISFYDPSEKKTGVEELDSDGRTKMFTSLDPGTGRTTGTTEYDPSIDTDNPVSKSTFKDGIKTSTTDYDPLIPDKKKSTTQYDPNNRQTTTTSYGPTTGEPDVTLNFNADGTVKEIFLYKDGKMVKSPRSPDLKK